MTHPALPDFEEITFTDGDTSKPVFVKGEADAPPVVLMHELPGLIPECIELARRLVDEGFCVFMPLLFGRVGARPLDMPLYTAQICIRNEFYLLAKQRSSPITEWLRALCREAKRRCNDQGCGVIGMCLTGGFGLVLMADDAVLAPVLSQPSLPFAVSAQHRKALAIDPATLERSVERSRAEGIDILGMRFTGDRMCPPQRFAELERLFGDQFLRVDIDSSLGNPDGIPPWAHSVLTVHNVQRQDHPTQQAYETMVEFLRRRLATPAA